MLHVEITPSELQAEMTVGCAGVNPLLYLSYKFGWYRDRLSPQAKGLSFLYQKLRK